MYRHSCRHTSSNTAKYNMLSKINYVERETERERGRDMNSENDFGELFGAGGKFLTLSAPGVPGLVIGSRFNSAVQGIVVTPSNIHSRLHPPTNSPIEMNRRETIWWFKKAVASACIGPNIGCIEPEKNAHVTCS